MPCRRAMLLPLLTACVALLCAGCIAPAASRRAERGGPAIARVVSFGGWRRCVRLDNGLARVTSVPQVGARTLEYRLGRYNFLFIARRELGTTLDDRPERTYRHYGGHFAQLHPVERWRGVQASYPAALFLGRYQARIPSEAGPVASVELTAAPDEATGTHLVRRIELFAGSTRVRITDTLTNDQLVPQQWGIHDFVQLKGCPTPSGVLRGSEEADGRIELYVPLNPKSRHPGGVRALAADEDPSRGVASQWSTARLPGLLALRYRGRFSKMRVDPKAAWVAFADRSTDHVFVQTCGVAHKELLTAGGPVGGHPFIELQCFGPVVRLEPGKSTTLTQEWRGARCPAPVVDVTDAGVVSSPLTLLRGEGSTWAAGTFGVFHVGAAALVFRGADGAELRRLDCGPVHPHRAFALNRVVELPKGTARVALEIRDTHGKPVGHLGEILLDAR